MGAVASSTTLSTRLRSGQSNQPSVPGNLGLGTVLAMTAGAAVAAGAVAMAVSARPENRDRRARQSFRASSQDQRGNANLEPHGEPHSNAEAVGEAVGAIAGVIGVAAAAYYSSQNSETVAPVRSNSGTYSWRITWSDGVTVRAEASNSSLGLGVRPFGSILRGHQERNWLVLEGELGFVSIYHSETWAPLMQVVQESSGGEHVQMGGQEAASSSTVQVHTSDQDHREFTDVASEACQNPRGNGVRQSTNNQHSSNVLERARMNLDQAEQMIIALEIGEPASNSKNFVLTLLTEVSVDLDNLVLNSDDLLRDLRHIELARCNELENRLANTERSLSSLRIGASRDNLDEAGIVITELEHVDVPNNGRELAVSWSNEAAFGLNGETFDSDEVLCDSHCTESGKCNELKRRLANTDTALSLKYIEGAQDKLDTADVVIANIECDVEPSHAKELALNLVNEAFTDLNNLESSSEGFPIILHRQQLERCDDLEKQLASLNIPNQELSDITAGSASAEGPAMNLAAQLAMVRNEAKHRFHESRAEDAEVHGSNAAESCTPTSLKAAWEEDCNGEQDSKSRDVAFEDEVSELIAAIKIASIPSNSKRAGLAVVQTLLVNILENPTHEKYRSVRTSNPKIQQTLFPQCFTLLQFAGFEVDSGLLKFYGELGSNVRVVLVYVESLLHSLPCDCDSRASFQTADRSSDENDLMIIANHLLTAKVPVAAYREGLMAIWMLLGSVLEQPDRWVNQKRRCSQQLARFPQSLSLLECAGFERVDDCMIYRGASVEKLSMVQDVVGTMLQVSTDEGVELPDTASEQLESVRQQRAKHFAQRRAAARGHQVRSNWKKLMVEGQSSTSRASASHEAGGSIQSVPGADQNLEDPDAHHGRVMPVLLHSLRFSQNTISSHFRDGREVEHTVKQLQRGELQVEDLPMLRVVEHMGLFWSLDNRRLHCLKRAFPERRFPGKTVAVHLLALTDGHTRAEFLRKFTTGTTVVTRGQ